MKKLNDLTLRGVVTGLVGLVVITFSSMYVALRMGALPWPTVFVTILAMAVLGKLKNSSLQEINVSHTLMSSGSMVAGGLAFTIPGLWILNPNAEISVLTLIVLTVSGAVLGTLYSAFFRKSFLSEKSLVYPIGKAAYDTLVTGINNGKQSLKLFASIGFSVVFTAIRDVAGLIPSVIGCGSVSFWVSPMALAIGSMIGSLSAYLWLGGAVIGLFIKGTVIRQSIGIGIMMGTGAGVLVKSFVPVFKAVKSKEKSNDSSSGLLAVILVSVVVSFVLAFGTEMTIIQSFLCVVGVCFVTLLSGILTGQSGVNPMEVFGILIMLAVSAVSKMGQNAMFVCASVTAVACGLCGDVMNDLKSGQMLGTNPKSQVIAEGIGGVAGALLSVVALLALKKGFGSFGTDLLPAPQAAAVATMAGGFGNVTFILIGLAIGFVLYMLHVPAATLGLGIYLSGSISFAAGLGAVISDVLKHCFKVDKNDVSIVASGFIGGEGICGVVIAIVSMLSTL